ncbi:RICIN domain-containing protein [Streptomyces sp. ME18-1-4]|uniref:RICIN domain-containing protein n=1 Tax=Streptomyces sp. ME18-1-4 TaxID=3028685 RepID=UPI0029BDD474|nr:RICIN domain-containing protein [Streptomyces sp. ME18-1-4]MDX3243802.1 RICIN domain-containing protein [Streptomyces sp. ME18-1-4]
MPDILRLPARHIRRTAAVTALLLTLAMLCGRFPTTAYAVTNTAITVDGASSGRTFDGIGAISGGGGNSRLLFDYPATQRNEILDYLFKPGYGASLQIFKVEMGGDTNSTDGAETSFQHTKGTIDCNAGYEWWLMEQAKARNPNIKLYAMPWGAPGWIGGGNFYSQDMVDYYIAWLGCAKQHGLTIDYVGGWNEHVYNASWYESLKSALISHGFTSTKLVGGDNWGSNAWTIATGMKNDSALYNAVDIAGAHYPCGAIPTPMTTCTSTTDAQTLGKPIWASENGSQDAETGAAAIARGLNRGYIDAKMTAYVNWPIVASIYNNMRFNDVGLLTANQPWSGNYFVGRSIWAMAQTTQFTSPGWKYLDTATGYLGGNRANGSYVSYAAPDKSAWSTVFETMDATASQTVTLNVTGSLPGGTLHVWSTDLSQPGKATPHMVKNADLTATGGTYTLTLAPGQIYTVTTTTGQGAGSTTPPQRSQLALPYSDSFAGYSTGQEAKYFATMNGAFQSAPCTGGRSGQCLRQTASGTPISWVNQPGPQPYTIMGDTGWSNYTVSSDVLLEKSGSAAEILGRVGTQATNNGGLNAYHLRLSDTGAWSLMKTNTSWTWTTLASGTVTAPGTNTWHNLALSFQGSTITAKIDGTTVGTLTDTSYGGGLAGLGTAGYYPVQYSNLSITPGTVPDLSGTYEIVGVRSGKALDAIGAATTNGTLIDQWTYSGGTHQQWTLARNTAGYYTVTGVGSGKALDIPNVTTWPGTQLELWTPNGGTNQQWQIAPNDNGSYIIESRSDGYRLDVWNNSTSDGGLIDQWPAGNTANQQWTLVKLS